MIKTDLIGSVEAATVLGIDRATLNRWAAQGEVPTAFKAPGKSGPRMFNRTDIEQLARARARSIAANQLQLPPAETPGAA